jgi:hypothetical protein
MPANTITTGKVTSSFVGASTTFLMTDAWTNVDGPTKGNWIKLPAIAQCEGQKAIPGVIVSPEMEVDVLYNNWRSITLEAGTLMEAEGAMAVENNRPLFMADLIRV